MQPLVDSHRGQDWAALDMDLPVESVAIGLAAQTAEALFISFHITKGKTWVEGKTTGNQVLTNTQGFLQKKHPINSGFV